MSHHTGKIILGCLFLLVGCSSPQTRSLAPGSFHRDNVLHISESQAKQIIRQAIHTGWPDKKASPMGDNLVGYEFKVGAGLKHDTVSALAISQGPNAYIFSVTNAGNAPETGAPARDKLLKLLASTARKSLHGSPAGSGDQAE